MSHDFNNPRNIKNSYFGINFSVSESNLKCIYILQTRLKLFQFKIVFFCNDSDNLTFIEYNWVHRQRCRLSGFHSQSLVLQVNFRATGWLNILWVKLNRYLYTFKMYVCQQSMKTMTLTHILLYKNTKNQFQNQFNQFMQSKYIASCTIFVFIFSISVVLIFLHFSIFYHGRLSSQKNMNLNLKSNDYPIYEIVS